MDVRRLEYFCAIINKGSISRAARSLHITQSPLSQRLKELEEELGCVLIHREGGAWTVTPEGEKLYRMAQHVLTFMRSAEGEIRSEAGHLQGRVRIGLAHPLREMGPKIIPDVLAANADLEIQAWVMDNQSLERHVLEGHLDFAVLNLPVRNDCYRIRRLRSLRLYALFGKGMEPPEGPTVDMRTLGAYPLAVQERREGGGVNEAIRLGLQKEGLTPKIVVTSQDPSMLRDLIVAGLPAVAVLNELEVERPDFRDFERRRLESVSNTVPAIIHLTNAYIGKAAGHIMDLVAERF